MTKKIFESEYKDLESIISRKGTYVKSEFKYTSDESESSELDMFEERNIVERGRCVAAACCTNLIFMKSNCEI